jgi:CheY-like chemotaxis protein
VFCRFNLKYWKLMILNKLNLSGKYQKRKTVRLLVIGDDSESAVNEYFGHLKDFTELSNHLYDIDCNFIHTGGEAYKQIADWHPNVILVDVHLPDINSFSILEHCKKEHLPVIVTSDFRLPDVEKSVENSGASAYIPKSDSPDDFEYLLNRIADLADEARIKH